MSWCPSEGGQEENPSVFWTVLSIMKTTCLTPDLSSWLEGTLGGGLGFPLPPRLGTRPWRGTWVDLEPGHLEAGAEPAMGQGTVEPEHRHTGELHIPVEVPACEEEDLKV